jgi:hypothetical protein
MEEKENLVEEELQNDAELVEETTEETASIEEAKKDVEEKTAKVEVAHEDEEEGDGEAGEEEEEEEMSEAKKSVKEMEHGDEEEDEEEEINAAHCEDVKEGAHEDEEDEEELAASYHEDLEVLVNSTEGLTEDFRDKASIIFEAAFTSKLREATEKLESEYEVKLTEETESIRTDLAEKVNSYLDYIVTEWVKENEVAIDAGLRSELTEDFMSALKTVFTENYIEVPESKVDLYEEVETKALELESQLQESTSAVAELKEQVEKLSREKILSEASDDLATTQSVKLASLVEDVEFVDADTFAKKVETIKESYFSNKSEEKELSEENDEIIETKQVVEGEEKKDITDGLSPEMKQYHDSLSRLFK